MNASTTREPFTKPLTGSEMRIIQQRISDVVRERTKPHAGAPVPITHEQMVKEVEEAIAFLDKPRTIRRLGRTFPPVCKVPSVALSAVVGA